MIGMMQENASESDVAGVVSALSQAGCRILRSGGARVMLGASGGAPDAALLARLPGVAEASANGSEYHLVSRRFRPQDTVIDLGRGVRVGGEQIVIIAGPCSVEDGESLSCIAAAVAAAGARGLRAGAFKPRSSPYSFQGMGEEALFLLRSAADANNLLVVSEVMEAAQIPLGEHYCDVIQVGARNMHNYALLRELGRVRRPILLKRGLAATLDEWLGAAEYIVASGNPDVILCERGIRTFETATRNTLDLSAIPAVKARTHLPVVVDPSHGTGRRDHVLPMSRAAVAAGADGLMIEVHEDPDRAISDAPQTIAAADFADLVDHVSRVAEAVDRRLA